jgi:hypothetical protein
MVKKMELASFVLYLIALALLPFRWLSPFSHQQAGWSDVAVAASAAVWLAGAVAARRPLRLRTPHYLAAGYLLAVTASAVAAENRSAAATNVVIVAELVVIFALTSEFARDLTRRCAIARVIYGVVLVTAAEAALGLLLFYLGHGSSLADGSSVYFKQSSLYTRVAAGFYSAPLLGSFCIAASSILALADNGLSRRARITGQVILAVLVLATVSRTAVAFAVAFAVREASRRGTARARRSGLAALALGTTVLVLLTVLPLTLDPLRPASTPAGINGRLADIESAPTVIVHHPLLGAGPGALTAVWHGAPRRPHFTPLNVAATTGIPSLLLVGTLLIVLWRRRGRPTDAAIWSGLLGLGLDALTQDVDHFRHVWLMLGLADADREPRPPPRASTAPRASAEARDRRAA